MGSIYISQNYIQCKIWLCGTPSTKEIITTVDSELYRLSSLTGTLFQKRSVLLTVLYTIFQCVELHQCNSLSLSRNLRDRYFKSLANKNRSFCLTKLVIWVNHFLKMALHILNMSWFTFYFMGRIFRHFDWRTYPEWDCHSRIRYNKNITRIISQDRKYKTEKEIIKILKKLGQCQWKVMVVRLF